MAGKRTNPRIGGDAIADIREHMKRDPVFAAGVRAELDNLQLARQVRALRERRKLTQAQLAERIGTEQPSIARLESGTRVPDLATLARIARALGARLDVRLVNATGRP
jgi:HTH-type transcriptional regulator/antitoxin HipB